MTKKQWQSWSPTTPPRTFYHLLQVLDWVTPILLRSAKLMIIAVPCHAIILGLWWLLASRAGCP